MRQAVVPGESLRSNSRPHMHRGSAPVVHHASFARTRNAVAHSCGLERSATPSSPWPIASPGRPAPACRPGPRAARRCDLPRRPVLPLGDGRVTGVESEWRSLGLGQLVRATHGLSGSFNARDHARQPREDTVVKQVRDRIGLQFSGARATPAPPAQPHRHPLDRQARSPGRLQPRGSRPERSSR